MKSSGRSLGIDASSQICCILFQKVNNYRISKLHWPKIIWGFNLAAKTFTEFISKSKIVSLCYL